MQFLDTPAYGDFGELAEYVSHIAKRLAEQGPVPVHTRKLTYQEIADMLGQSSEGQRTISARELAVWRDVLTHVAEQLWAAHRETTKAAANQN